MTKDARGGKSAARIALATTRAEISRCHAVMRELRPKFIDTKKFVRRCSASSGKGICSPFSKRRVKSAPSLVIAAWNRGSDQV
jgi:hypothetical protein